MTKSKIVGRLATVGYICATWSNFEAAIAQAIWIMLNLDDATGRIVTGGLDMRPRANMAVRLARHLKMPTEFTRALEDARASLDNGLMAKRNLAVHGIHHPRTQEDAMMLDLHRGKHKKPEPFTDTDLNAFAEELYQAYKAFVDALKVSVASRMRRTASSDASSSGSQSDGA